MASDRGGEEGGFTGVVLVVIGGEGDVPPGVHLLAEGVQFGVEGLQGVGSEREAQGRLGGGGHLDYGARGLDRVAGLGVIQARGGCTHRADGGRVVVDRVEAGAIRIEARGDDRLESDAASVLLGAIRRQFGGDVESVPSFNDAHGTPRVPLRMVDQAAGLADARGL
ncbi:DUF6197 family protein [Streptomyces mirabilis]|uniref:DUF6197 family protein n=1 Tax=Streptomyces mirabilis TaxID=68239 RepID=UPI003FA2CCD2